VKLVPLVVDKNGERTVIGEAAVHRDGKVYGQITEVGLDLEEVLKSGFVFGTSPLGEAALRVDICPTPNCPGDARYASPGRRHIEGCSYPRPEDWS